MSAPVVAPIALDSAAELAVLHDALKALTLLKARGKGKRRTYTLFDSTRVLSLWKFNEWDYGREDTTLPINARGLFLDESCTPPRIAIRGYDKFFNVGENRFTTKEHLAATTTGPYEVTMKENGCIVFVLGLEDGTLVVCSKHSTGERVDAKNHALEGQNYLKAQLARVNKQPRDLALELYNANLTAVAEYCNDEFEEHVLAYETPGLYLHGLNHNTAKFATRPMDEVEQFATTWGFVKTEFFVEPDFDKLTRFLEACAETGTHNGKEIEGFVIRGKTTTGDDLFWKYKFEQPYLMYRLWREATRSYLTGKNNAGKIPLGRVNKQATVEYLKFAIPLLALDPKLREQYKNGYGIIALRERFLEALGTSGIELASKEDVKSHLERDVAALVAKYPLGNASAPTPEEVLLLPVKYLLVPVATIGTGKTTVGHALSLLTGCAHVQSDNFTKPVGPKLAKAAVAALATCDIVYVDRNNHMKREREQLLGDIAAGACGKYQLRFICLDFVGGTNMGEVWDTTLPRVLGRGDNHQTVQANTIGRDKVEMIMRGFIGRFQPVDVSEAPDSGFDRVVELQPGKLVANTQKVLRVLAGARLVGGFKEKQVAEAVEQAMKAKVTKPEPRARELKKGKTGAKQGKDKGRTNTKTKGKSDTPKTPRPVYFALAVPATIFAAISPTLDIPGNLDPSAHPHVTLVHSAHCRQPEGKALYEHYLRLFEEPLSKLVLPKGFVPLGPTADVDVTSAAVTERVACVGVKIAGDWPCANAHPHVTLAVAAGAKPVELNQAMKGKTTAVLGSVAGCSVVAYF